MGRFDAVSAAVRFSDAQLAAFVRGLMLGAGSIGDADHAVLVHDDLELRLVSRLSEGRSSIVRYRESDSWMITGFYERDLAQTVSRLATFLTPSYGRFTEHAANLRAFEPGKGGIHALGHQLSLAGYQRLETEPAHLTHVKDALRAWLRLEELRPSFAQKIRPTYRELMSAFRSALATSNWSEAEQIVEETSRHRLTSADNVVFLTLQLMAKQEQWTAIWNDPRFGEWTKQRLPRAIRTALIQSFHHTVLLPMEQDAAWAEALDVFRRERPRLGNLLETRPQESSPPIASVFAYAAVDGADAALAAGLRETLPSDVLRRIEPILNLLPIAASPADANPTFTADHRAKIALLDGDLDLARETVNEIDDQTTRVVILIDLANRSLDVADIEAALSHLTELPTWRLNELYAKRPYLQAQVEAISSLFFTPIEGSRSELTIAPLTWSTWFEALTNEDERSDLAMHLTMLIAKSDERLWEPDEALAIADRVLSVVALKGGTSASLVKQAIGALTDLLLIDDEFPRAGHAYTELYETVYTFMLEHGSVNDANSRKLLRLAEAILVDDPARVRDILRHVQSWFVTPRVVLADRMLDALELVAEYGIEAGALVRDFRTWADVILDSPIGIAPATLHAWCAFGRAIQAGDDLITRFDNLGTAQDDPIAAVIAKLPKDFRIAIFTLRPKSAERVRQLMLVMNPEIDIQISSETDLSPRVQQLASSADLPVVVTSCITHALTYGIGPSLGREPVRPESSGSTSIMRSIWSALQTQ